MPLPVAIEVVVEPTVMLKLPDGSAEVLLASESEYHEPAVARLLMVTVLLLAAVPSAAVAVRALVFELVAMAAERTPSIAESEFSASLTAEASVSSWLMAEVWLESVACCACQLRSGARSA